MKTLVLGVTMVLDMEKGKTNLWVVTVVLQEDLLN